MNQIKRKVKSSIKTRRTSNKKLIDITKFVKLVTKYGYKFTTDDAINIVKNYFYISNTDDYDIELTHNELNKVIKEMDYNPYNIKMDLTIEMLEKKCENKFTLADIKELLKQNKNKNLKLNDKCLENLILLNNSKIISFVIKTYQLQPTMKCIKNAIDSNWKSNHIKPLFDSVYINYFEKDKIIEIKKEPIEVVPKKKISSK